MLDGGCMCKCKMFLFYFYRMIHLGLFAIVSSSVCLHSIHCWTLPFQLILYRVTFLCLMEGVLCNFHFKCTMFLVLLLQNDPSWADLKPANTRDIVKISNVLVPQLGKSSF